MTGPEPTPPQEATSRRTALRRSALLLAGTAGALAAPALAGPAQADPGDALRLGTRNQAGDAQTRLESDATLATLSVLNERVRRDDSIGDVDLVAPQLRLAGPIPGSARPQLPDLRSITAGDLAAAGGLLYFGADAGDFEVIPAQVHTSAFATYLQPVPLSRAVLFDSRSLSADDRALYAADTFTGQGLVAAGQRVALDLRGLVDTSSVTPRAAVAVTLQVLDATVSGAVSVFSDATAEDGLELLGYAVLPAELTRTNAPYPLPATGAAVLGLDDDDRLWLGVSSAVHLVVRVTGVFVADPSAVVDAPSTLGTGSRSTGGTAYSRRVHRQREALRRLTADLPRPR